MNQRLKGKLAVITGGTSGIGLATAQLFLEEGARVVVTGSRASSVEASRAVLGDAVRSVVSDTTDAAEVESLFDGVQRELGAIDVLFLNAGLLGVGSLAEMDEAGFDDVVRVDLKGPWLALRAALPRLAPGASVIVNTSIANAKGWPGLGAYGAAKAGLTSLVRTATAELAPRGIRVNAISPGPTDTPMFGKFATTPEEATAAATAMGARIPLGRLGRPREIAQAALFLASSESSFVVGAELVVDGGMSQV